MDNGKIVSTTYMQTYFLYSECWVQSKEMLSIKLKLWTVNY